MRNASEETLRVRKWICSHLSNTNKVSEYKLIGRAEENTVLALLIPPRLDVPYFQVKYSLLPFSALWSSPAILLSIISFCPLFWAVGVEGLLKGKRWSDLIYIKSVLTEDNSSSDFLLIRLRHQRAGGTHGPDNRQSVRATGQPVHASARLIVLSLCRHRERHAR